MLAEAAIAAITETVFGYLLDEIDPMQWTVNLITAQIDWATGNITVGKNNRQFNYNIQTLIVQQQPLPPTVDPAQTRTAYLRWLIDRNRYLDPRGTQQTTRQVQLKLDEVYISLRAQVEESQSSVDRRLLDQELRQLDAESADLSAVEQEDRRDHLHARLGFQYREISVPATPVDLAEAVKRHEQLVILGDPGSGKTTLLRYLALQSAEALVNEQPGRFPILVRIADYAEDGAWKGQALSDFLPTAFARMECKSPGLAELLQEELTQGDCLILLDGLDEIVEADDRRGVVQQIEDFIRRHDQGGLRGENRFIVTSRIAGYRSAPLAGSGGAPLPHYVVQEMDDEQIARFLERWCRAVEDFQTPDLSAEARQATAQREIDGILDAVKMTPGVRRLASNPLMLRVLALIHRTGARLPQKRVELYKLATDTLARTWRTAQGVPESALVNDNNLTPLLGQLAYWMHEHKPSGIATEREVYAQLGAAFAKRNHLIDWDPDEPDPAVMTEIDKFLLAVREHTGLFVERAPKRYGFMHLTFEEYYAARHLVARTKNRAQLIRHHLHDARWEEPILLALGFVGLDYPDEAAELVETAILAQGEEAEELGFAPSEYEELLGRDYLFALRCLGDEIPVDPRAVRALLAQVADELLYRSGLARFQHYRQLLSERLEHLKGSNAAHQLAIQLLSALRDEKGYVRSRVAVSLGQLGSASPEVVAGLLSALRDEEGDVRSRAAVSLGQLGSDAPEVVAGLLTALHDEEIYVRLQATASLGQLGSDSPEVVAGLLTALHDEEAAVQLQSVEILGELGIASKLVVDSILATLLNSQYAVYYLVLRRIDLGIASKAVVEGLLTEVHNKESSVRARAIKCLGVLGADLNKVVEMLLSVLLDENEEVRSQTVSSLGELGVSSNEVIEALMTMMFDENKEVRSQAASSLGKLGVTSDTVVTSLATALLDENEEVRSQAASSLGELGVTSDIVLERLRVSLYDEFWEVRSEAAEALGKLGISSPAVVKELFNTLNDEDEIVQWKAAESLVELGNISAIINGLSEALMDESCNIKDLAAVSLGRLGNSSDIIMQKLFDAAQNAESWSLRCEAARLIGIGARNVKDAWPILHHVLLDKSEDEDVRIACCIGLGLLAKRFPSTKSDIARQLAQNISTIKSVHSFIIDSVPLAPGLDMSQNDQDYLYQALYRVMAG